MIWFDLVWCWRKKPDYNWFGLVLTKESQTETKPTRHYIYRNFRYKYTYCDVIYKYFLNFFIILFFKVLFQGWT